MNRTELLDLIRNGESSHVEFKRDGVKPSQLAKEMVAFLNTNGGQILLGVEDDGDISGLTREPKAAEEWVMQAARDHIKPVLSPYWETVRCDGDAVVGVITVGGEAPDKPYKAKHGNHWITHVRVGSTTRDASREEEERLYQQAGRVQYGLKPVHNAGLDALDRRRLNDYFLRVRGEAYLPGDNDDEWCTLLRNLELMTVVENRKLVTVDGLLLFGLRTHRFLPQSGIRAVCYPGTEADYATRADEDLRGPMLPLKAEDGSLVESGLVEQAVDFIGRYTTPSAHLQGAQRTEKQVFPRDVVREAVVNALVHRDYSIAGTDIMLAIYSDRLEITSPGRLPNTITIDGMKAGARYARNQNLVNFMRDYNYVEARGMGVRNKIIRGMRAHNGTEPDLMAEDSRFTVRLWKHKT